MFTIFTNICSRLQDLGFQPRAELSPKVNNDLAKKVFFVQSNPQAIHIEQKVPNRKSAIQDAIDNVGQNSTETNENNLLWLSDEKIEEIKTGITKDFESLKNPNNSPSTNAQPYKQVLRDVSGANYSIQIKEDEKIEIPCSDKGQNMFYETLDEKAGLTNKTKAWLCTVAHQGIFAALADGKFMIDGGITHSSKDNSPSSPPCKFDIAITKDNISVICTHTKNLEWVTQKPMDEDNCVKLKPNSYYTIAITVSAPMSDGEVNIDEMTLQGTYHKSLIIEETGMPLTNWDSAHENQEGFVVV